MPSTPFLWLRMVIFLKTGVFALYYSMIDVVMTV
jgi:hypothetical protein